MKDLIARAGTWILTRRAGVLWFIMLVVAGAIALYLSQRAPEELFKWSSLPAPVRVALPIVALGLIGHCIHCFTRDLPCKNANKRLSRELRSIFVYAYIFQGLMFVSAFSPFVVLSGSSSTGESLAGVVHGCVLDQEQDGSGLTRCANGAKDGQWLLHIGSGQLQEQADGPVVLSRGLAVPLYVVVLGIIGGAVGMSRRLPELQRRAAHSYEEKHKDGNPNPISSIEAREQIVFQIMQVVAAPLIAIVAFAALEPDTVTAAVLIGFASGFSSEPILLKLRAAGEAMAGISAPKASGETLSRAKEESKRTG